MAELKNRSEVDVNLTWDLSLIYATEADYEADVERMKALTAEIESYKGRLNTPENIACCAEKNLELTVIADHVGTYASLGYEVDYTNDENAEKAARMRSLMADVYGRLSFIKVEVCAQSEETIRAAMEKTESCRGYLGDMLREKPHTLSAETEKAVAALSQTLDAPYEIYNTIKLADMEFPSFEADGKTHPLSYSMFEDDYEYSADTELRRNAFRAFYDKLSEYKHSTAAAFNAHCVKEKTIAQLRGFKNAEEMSLFSQKVTSEMYNRQIDIIMEKLAPHMRRFVSLVKRVNGLDKLTWADLHVPVDPDFISSVTIDEAREMLTKGLAILGDDYVSMINEAFDKRWVDFAQNKGKCTGGFCASPYRVCSFILMSWYGRMSDVMTLAHELGHAGHFRLCSNNQSCFDNDVSTYFVEAPSTMNEIILTHYLMRTNTDKRFRRWVLSNMVADTYYHNCVTHLLEAAYQREVYRIIDEGGSVRAETLSGIFRDVLKKFWGDEVELPEGCELTWMRQPHYYMGLYSYSYSAGLTIATQMCKRIEREGAPAAEDWKKVLAAGSTLDPMGLAKLGGVDISTDAALIDTIETIGGYVDEICRLTDEIEAEK